MIRVADRYAEAEAIACRIRSLVESGARYGEIAIIARSADKLRGILDTALARHGIPHFLSERTDVSTRPAARLLLAALSVVSGGWRREDVILCAKTGLCSLTDAECDALELYTQTWHIRGERSFSAPWTGNPDGYVEKVSARGKRILTCVIQLSRRDLDQNFTKRVAKLSLHHHVSVIGQRQNTNSPHVLNIFTFGRRAIGQLDLVLEKLNYFPVIDQP
jgi:ATP-dependent helicase/DNAse subunit B